MTSVVDWPARESLGHRGAVPRPLRKAIPYADATPYRRAADHYGARRQHHRHGRPGILRLLLGRRRTTGQQSHRRAHGLRAGWAKGQFGCLSRLWTRESNWDHRARNRSSGAYGIPQALPGGKMASAGSDWRTNPKTQIKWGLTYIKKRYGSPCGAWAHFQSRGWY